MRARLGIFAAVLLLPACGGPPSNPLFTLSDAAIVFNAQQGGAVPPDQALLIMGGDRLPFGAAAWTASSNQPWLVLSRTSGEVASKQTIPIGLSVNQNFQTEAWVGATSTVGAPFVDASTFSGWGAWVGTALMVWSGDPSVPMKSYDPVSDTWFGAASTAGAPSQRLSPSAVWTGTELIFWGGYVVSGGVPTTALNTGARYNPATDTWRPMSTTGAPSARTAHRAIWTGTRMIIWGGDGLGFTYTNTGGIYDPATDSWVGATSTVNAPSPRGSAAVVWTGSRMIVWGGENPGKFGDGALYDPGSDTWTGTTSPTGAPTARSHMPGVWTGQEMIIWGGTDGSTDLNTGARYNPSSDSWIPLTTTGAPEARSSHLLAWTGTEMIAWGGVDASTNLNTGGIYRPPALLPGTYNAQVLIQAATLGQASVEQVQVTLTVTP